MRRGQVLLAALPLLACAGNGARPIGGELEVADGRYRMGTVLDVRLATGGRAAGRALLERIFAEVARLEGELSNHDPASALARLNARAGSGPVPVPPDLLAALSEAGVYAERTGGSFDVTVGPLVALWTAAARRGRLPADAELTPALARVGARRVRVAAEAGTVALEPGTELDLGGLGKGFALDRVEGLLRQARVPRALVSFGGSSLLALGGPPGERGWRVLLDDGRGGCAGLLRLHDARLSVSSSLGQSSIIEGRRFGHLLDPRTDLPLERAGLAAVVAPSGAEAEAWSKALLVLPPEEALARVRARPDVEALILEEPGAARTTPGWASAVAYEPCTQP